MHVEEKCRKKYMAGIYVLFLIICVFLIVCKGIEPKEKLLTEAYGLSRDDAVELTKEREVSSVYKASQENMYGVSVRFLSEERFSKEEVVACVYDEQTGALLAEDRVQLKNERIQNKDGGSSIYFSLPVEDVKNRQLRLAISMAEGAANVYPSLVLSNSKKTDSQLFIDGKPSAMDLIFSVVYFTGQSSNVVEAVVHGALWIIIGTVLFLFVFFKDRQDTVSKKRLGKNKIQERIASVGVCHSKKAGIVCIALFLGIVMVCVYKYGVSDVMQNGKFWYFKRMYAVLCLMLLAVAAIAYVICFIKKCTTEKVFVALGLPLGIIFGLVIALNTVPDEPSHIDTAYSLANELLGIPKSEKPGYIYKRAEDVDAFAEEKQNLNKRSYKYLYEELFEKAEDETLVECAVRSNLGNAGEIYYLPQAIGIVIGRLTGLGMMPTMMLGRFLSLLAYISLVYFAICKLPFGKTTLLLIGILPISLQQAASFSYDGIINGVAFLYTAYCLFAIYTKEQLRFGDVAVIVFTGSMICSVKGGVYAALSLLPLMALVVKRSLPRKQGWIYWTFFAVGVFSFLSKNLAKTLLRFSVESGTVTGGAASTQIYTFSDILHAPVKFVGMFLNTFYEQGDKYIRNLFGGNLAWRDINISWIVVFGFVFVVLLSCIQNGRERKITGMERCYLGVIAFGAFCCVELSMLLAWTPVTYDYITGVQGRYFLPFFLLVLVACRNSFVKLRKNIDYQLIFGAVMLNIVTVLQVVQRALE